MHFSLRSCRVALVAAVLAALSTLSARADTLLVTQSGTFSSSTPTSSFSAPNGTYAISFNVNSTPIVNASSDHFDVNYTNFKFLLNGVVSTTPTAFISFYNDADGGLFSVCFSTTCPVNANPSDGFALLGAQAYSGALTAPTILTGSYAIQGSTLMVGSSSYSLASTSNANITTLAATPEPSSLMLLGTGLLGLAGAVRRRLA